MNSAPSAEERVRFEAEIHPLLPRLHRFCLSLCRDPQEAEDVLQDALVRAYLHRDSYQRRGSFFGWLCGIARNQFVEHRRAQARRRSLLDSVLEGAAAVLGSLFTGGQEQADAETRLCQSQEAELMMRCLRALPEKFRLVVLLCDVEELGYDEAAATLGIPLGTVKSRHSRGRAQLGEAFKTLLAERAQVANAGGGSSSSRDARPLPALPPAARSALEALRHERPSAGFESRLIAALRAADEGRLRKRPPARPSTAPFLLGTVMAGLLVLITLQTDPHHALTQAEELPSHLVAFRLPAQGEGWLELPWKPSLHSGEPATVRLESPEELDFHQHANDLPALRLVSCGAGRCVHQFTASTGVASTPLRVRIDKPGRYEFRVSHASLAREVHEHFVVVAGP